MDQRQITRIGKKNSQRDFKLINQSINQSIDVSDYVLVNQSINQSIEPSVV